MLIVSIPDQLAIAIYFPDAMKRYRVSSTEFIDQLEIKAVLPVKEQFS